MLDSMYQLKRPNKAKLLETSFFITQLFVENMQSSTFIHVLLNCLVLFANIKIDVGHMGFAASRLGANK